MVDRRHLTEGLKPTVPAVDPKREQDFVYADKATKDTPPPSPPPSPQSVANFSRVPLSTRIRGDFAVALKRASLERQLNGVEPNTLQDILEQAIEPWLKANGYVR